MSRMIVMGALLATVAFPAAAKEAPLAACMAARADAADLSGVALVVRNGASTTFARGKVEGPDSTAITADTRFNMGSMTKMFTAIAVAQLIEAGKVSLDDPIGKHVDGLTPGTSAVTVRQLLTHSGGLGSIFRPDTEALLANARATRDLKPIVATETPGFTRGSRHQYSNSGFVLLGLLVEAASGQDYADYLDAHVFKPAGMSKTSLALGDAATRATPMTRGMGEPRRLPPGGPNAAPPGPGGPDMRMMPPPADGPLRPFVGMGRYGSPAGGAYSTAADMARFFQALLAGRLIRPETLRSFTGPQIVAAPARGDRPELHYGFGFGNGSFDGHRWFGHNGGAPGVNADGGAFPDDDTIIVVMSNRDPPAAGRLYNDLRGIMLDDAKRATCG